MDTLSLHTYSVVHLAAIPRPPFLWLENDEDSLHALLVRKFLTNLLFPVVKVTTIGGLDIDFKGVAQSVVQALLEG